MKYSHEKKDFSYTTNIQNDEILDHHPTECGEKSA